MNQQRKAKGQSAIEYLTTYGWMLLVVAIVGGSIFTTVQNSADIQSVSGLNNAEVQVSNYGLNEEGIQMTLQSAAVDQVNIRKITVTDPKTGITAEINPSKVFAVGDTAQFELKDVQKTKTTDTYDLSFTYDVGGLTGKVAEGQIKGSFDVFNKISLTGAEFNRSNNELQIDVKNTGDNTTDSINYTVEANNTEYNGSISNLNPRETQQINISTDETYLLESVNLDTEGYQFVDSSSNLKCTPTKGLIGYWTFNDEQTQNGYATDLSGEKNNLSKENGVEISSEGIAGESFKFDGANDFLKSEEPLLNNKNDFSLVGWVKSADNSTQESLYGQNNAIEFFLSKSKDIRLWTASGGNTETEYNHYGSFEMLTALGNSSKLKIYTGANKLTVGGTTNSDYGSSSDTFKIGRGIQSPGSGPFKGEMDEIRIYNRSLSQNEIQRLYNVRSEDWAVSGCKLTE